MSGGPDNLVLTCLRRLDAKFEKMADDIREIKQRLGHLEEQMASVSCRIDGLDMRLERVERRLDLVEG